MYQPPNPHNDQTTPTPQRGAFWRWYDAKSKRFQIGCSLLTVLTVLFLCIAVGNSVANSIAQSIPTITSTPTITVTQVAHANSVSPTSIPTHAATPTTQPTATPTTVVPTPTQVAAAQPTPTPKPSCNAVNGNPWCYNFSPGKLIYIPPDGFCNYFNCIPTFYAPDDPGDGYIVECQDQTFSQSGGESGSCSHHGGNLRPLYSH